MVVDLELPDQRSDILLRLLKVAIHKPVIGIARNADRSDRSAGQRVIGNAKVGQSAQIGVDVIGRHAYGAGRRPLHCRQSAPAIVSGKVTLRYIGVLPHAIHADGESRSNDLVDVEGETLGGVARKFRVGVVEAGLRRRLLGDDVYRAAGRAAAIYRGRRSFEDLDLLREEIFPDVHGGIADAVNKDIVTRIEAADEKPIAEGVATLTGSDCHARGRSRDILEAGGVLVSKNFLRQHGDASWRVGDRLADLRMTQADWPYTGPPDPHRDLAAPLALSPRPLAAWPVRRPWPSLRAGARRAPAYVPARAWQPEVSAARSALRP